MYDVRDYAPLISRFRDIPYAEHRLEPIDEGHGKMRLFSSCPPFRLVCWPTFVPATAHIGVRLAHKHIVTVVRNDYCTSKYRDKDDALNWQKVVDRNEF